MAARAGARAVVAMGEKWVVAMVAEDTEDVPAELMAAAAMVEKTAEAEEKVKVTVVAKEAMEAMEMAVAPAALREAAVAEEARMAMVTGECEECCARAAASRLRRCTTANWAASSIRLPP